MKKTKYILTLFILGAFIQFTGCGTEGDSVDSVDSGKSNEYRTELTEEEIKGGHVSFQMGEKLVVDADVTAKEKYEKGLSSYYLKVFCETDKESEKKFLEAPTLSLHSFGEWEEMLNKIVPGKFKDKAFKIDKKDADIQQTYKGEDSNSYSFHVGWSNYTRGVAEKTGFNSPIITFEIEDGNALSGKANSVRNYVQNYHGSSKTDFLQDVEENAERMKEFLQEATGRPVFEGYDFSVVSKETIDMLNQAQPLMEAEEPEEEYAAFYFYYDIDGLPFKNLKLNYFMENDDTADELCYWGAADNILMGNSEHEQELILGKDGIIYLECSNRCNTGEVYKEGLSVVNPNEILKQVKEHYDRQLMVEECVVTEIGLVYTGYFSDGADGKLQPVISPFWAVKVYNGDAGMYAYFVYDAYTGECVREGM